MNENQYGTNSLPESFDKNDDLNSNSYDEHASNSDECNLIVNYLPHDIDDQSLKVCKLLLIYDFFNIYVIFSLESFPTIWRNSNDQSCA